MNQPKRIVEMPMPGLVSAIAEINARFNSALDKAAEAPPDHLIGREVSLPSGGRGIVTGRSTEDSSLLIVALSDGTEKVFNAFELSLIQEDL